MAEKASDQILVHAPAATIMGVITDFEAYPEWTSNICDVEVRATDTDGRATHVWYAVDAKVLQVEYVLGYRYHGDHRLTWELVEGEQLDRLDGEYLLTDEAGGVRVRYTLEVDVTLPLPGFVKKRAAKQILETGLGELRRRAESLA
jgi:uncharacterized membrane protein